MNYYAIYYNVTLAICIASFLAIQPSNRRNQVVEVPSLIMGFIVLIFVVWCIGSEPFVIGSWTDRGCYSQAVIDAQRRGFDTGVGTGEIAFSFYVYLVSLFANPTWWFYITALIYVGNLLFVSWRLTRSYGYVLFLSFLIAFQFYGYGTNTIRAGFAASLILVGLTYCNNLKMMALIWVFALFCHKSMMIPIGALALAYKLPKTKWYLWFWLLCIVFSYAGGSVFQSYFASLTHDTRADYLTQGSAFYKTGFRWDFLAYSAIPVILGYFYIYSLKFKSAFYQWVYNGYLIANSFWILVIRAAYTDRFAYLSWFMFPILLIYPLLTKQFFRDCSVQARNIILVLLGQIAFSYFMFWAYNGHKFF